MELIIGNRYVTIKKGNVSVSFERRRRMKDYTVNFNENMEIMIESEQEHIRTDVIKQYIKCRKELGMTQADVAEVLSTRRPNITRFENGSYNPTLDFLVKVAESMGKKLEIKLMDKEI